MALLEEKNAELAEQLARSKENEKKLESEIELQHYIIDELNDDVKARDYEIARHKEKQLAFAERAAGPAYIHLLAVTELPLRGMFDLREHHIEIYRTIHRNRRFYYGRRYDDMDVENNITKLYNYLDARK